MEEFGEVLLDVHKEYKRSNKLKDIIIIILIVLMFLQSAFSFGCFVWYESQFDYVTTNGKDVDVETSGDNANADQLRSRKVYHTNVATDVGTFMVSSCELCGISYNFPVI